MFKMFAGIGTIAFTIAITLGIASAQTDTAQPSRNDPPPAAPNQSSKDPVPPATDPSLPIAGGNKNHPRRSKARQPTIPFSTTVF